MKKAVIQSAYMAMKSGLSVKESVILGFVQKDEFDAALLIAGFYLHQDPTLGTVSLNSSLSISKVPFPGDIAVDRHGFMYISLASIRDTDGPKPKWLRSRKPFLAKKIQNIINVMTEYAESKEKGQNL